MKLYNFYNRIKQFKNDTNGNFGVMASTTMLALISGIGLTIDGQRFYSHAEKA